MLATLVTAVAGTASAQVVQVNNNGTLTAATDTVATNNDLTLNTGSSGFNFSGSTGSFFTPTSGNFSSPAGASTGGYYYADYLITINSATAESVTTSLQNPSVVADLTERIYTYNPSAGTNGFLGDLSLASAGVTGEQLWSTNYPLPGVNVSIVSPSDLSAGSYVIELRGNSAGNFGGSLSITPIPEPNRLVMLICGLCLIFLVGQRRNLKRQGRSLRQKMTLSIANSIEAFLFREKTIGISSGSLG
jgi:hypothetical protein